MPVRSVVMTTTVAARVTADPLAATVQLASRVTVPITTTTVRVRAQAASKTVEAV